MRWVAAAAVGATTAGLILGACVGDDGSAPITNNPDTGAPANLVDAGSGTPDVGTQAPPDTGAPEDTGAPVDAGTDTGSVDSGADAAPTFGGVGGITLWLSGDALITTDNGGTNVQEWQPKAGPPLVFTPVTGGGSPTRTLIGSKHAIHFDGATGSGNCGCPGLSATLTKPIEQPFTMFLVGEADRVTDGTFRYDGVFFQGSTSPFTFGLINKAGNAPFWMINAGTELDGTGIDAPALSKLHVFSAVLSGSSSIFRVDGTGANTTDVGLDSLAGTMQLGTGTIGTTSLQGDIGEIIFFDGAMQLADVLKVEAALKTEWSLQ